MIVSQRYNGYVDCKRLALPPRSHRRWRDPKEPGSGGLSRSDQHGHGGCLTTTHANGAVDTLRRISNLLAWSTSSGISSETIDRLVSQNTDLIIHIRKVYEGMTYRRRVTEVLKIDLSGEQEFIVQ